MRVSKEKFSFLSGLEIQPKQTKRFIELLAMKMNPLILLVVIPLLVLSGPYVNAGPVGDFFKKVGQSISKPLQPRPEPQPQPQSARLGLSLSLSLSRRSLNLRRRRTPRGDPLRDQHLRPPRRHPRRHNHHTRPKKENLLALCGVFQPRIWKKQKLVCPMEFRSLAGKAWSRVLICRKRTSISM